MPLVIAVGDCTWPMMRRWFGHVRIGLLLATIGTDWAVEGITASPSTATPSPDPEKTRPGRPSSLGPAAPLLGAPYTLRSTQRAYAKVEPGIEEAAP
jgi:hypothetical protein